MTRPRPRSSSGSGGEYGTKTEARQELGVHMVITDDDWYEYLKLFACFLKQAGYAGMLIFD